MGGFVGEGRGRGEDVKVLGDTDALSNRRE